MPWTDCVVAYNLCLYITHNFWKISTFLKYSTFWSTKIMNLCIRKITKNILPNSHFRDRASSLLWTPPRHTASRHVWSKGWNHVFSVLALTECRYPNQSYWPDKKAFVQQVTIKASICFSSVKMLLYGRARSCDIPWP